LINQNVKSCGCKKRKRQDFCAICGAPIPDGSKYYNFCSDACAEKGKEKSRKKYTEKKRAERMTKKKPARAVSSLDKVLKELREYNERNNTNLSYGQFVHKYYNSNNKSSSA
jgi:predicted nucleic acid-binding Zn ribbon protein